MGDGGADADAAMRGTVGELDFYEDGGEEDEEEGEEG